MPRTASKQRIEYERAGPNAGARPLPDAKREAIALFTEGDIGRRGLEHCIAVLMREGVDLQMLRQFEGLTRERIGETVESVMVRVRHEMDRAKTLNTDRSRDN